MSQLLQDLPTGSLVKDLNTLYNNSPIVWRILEHDHSGDPYESTALEARDIITLKCFDAKEPNNPDTERHNYGNNRYRYSNILQWLNSDAAEDEWYEPQHDTDEKPDSENVMTVGSLDVPLNPYDGEAGFLSNFSKSLRRCLALTEKNVVIPPADAEVNYEKIHSKVFLLSGVEVGLTYADSAEGDSAYTFYRENNDNAKRLKNLSPGVDIRYSGARSPWNWWLRNPNSSSGSSYHTQFVNTGGNLDYGAAYDGSVGVAPAICISKNISVSDEPDEDGVYILFHKGEITNIDLHGDIYSIAINTSSLVDKSDITDLPNISAKAVDFAIDAGTYFYYYGSLVKAKVYIASRTQLRYDTSDTEGNIERVNIGNELKTLSEKKSELKFSKKLKRKRFVPHTFNGSNIPDNGENIWRHKNRTFCNTYGKSYELINNEWVNISWSGGSPTYARDIWTDGEHIYYKLDYEIDVDHLRLTSVTFTNGPSSFRGEYVWTDGEDVYFCQGTNYYVLDKDTLTWSTTTFTGSMPYIYSNNIWTDGFDIYLGKSYVLSKTTKRKFEATSWNGIDTDFDGYNVWTDGENLYESMSGTTYLIDVPTKTARKITLFDDNKSIKGFNIWSDGKNIYHTESNETHILIEEEVNLHKYY